MQREIAVVTVMEMMPVNLLGPWLPFSDDDDELFLDWRVVQG
jgi:hypothetical protein